MTDPTYDAQVAEVRRRGRINAAIALPFTLLAGLAAFSTMNAIGGHLDGSLYEPACNTACDAAGGTMLGHRLGGRGESGEVHCECTGTKDRWHDADLSRGPALDTALHRGGQELLSFVVFLGLAMPGLFLGNRMSRRR